MSKRKVIKTRKDDIINDEYNTDISKEDTQIPTKNENISAEIQTLVPFSEYDIRMYAENKVGLSNPSNPIIRIQTKEEAPEGTPTSIVATSNSSQSLVISWKVRQKSIIIISFVFTTCYLDWEFDELKCSYYFVIFVALS